MEDLKEANQHDEQHATFSSRLYHDILLLMALVLVSDDPFVLPKDSPLEIVLLLLGLAFSIVEHQKLKRHAA